MFCFGLIQIFLILSGQQMDAKEPDLTQLLPLFNGVGPHHYNKKYTWEYKGLLVGFDPVAVDSVGIRILQEKRRDFFEEDRPIKPPVKHIYLADTRHHLGTADPARIDLIKMGWNKDILI